MGFDFLKHYNATWKLTEEWHGTTVRRIYSKWIIPVSFVQFFPQPDDQGTVGQNAVLMSVCPWESSPFTSQLKIKVQNIKVVDKVVQGSRGGGSFIPRAKKVPAWTFCTCQTMNDPVLNRSATFLLWLPLVFSTELIHNSHTCYWRGVTTLERGRPYILGWFCAQLQKVFSGRTFATK